MLFPEKLSATIREDLGLSDREDISKDDIKRWIQQRNKLDAKFNATVNGVGAWLAGTPVEAPRRGMMARALDFSFERACLEEAIPILEERILRRPAHPAVQSMGDPKGFQQLVQKVEKLLGNRGARSTLKKISGFSNEFWYLLSSGRLVPDTGKLLVILHVLNSLLEASAAGHLKTFTNKHKRVPLIKGRDTFGVEQAMKHLAPQASVVPVVEKSSPSAKPSRQPASTASTSKAVKEAVIREPVAELNAGDVSQLYMSALQALYGPMSLLASIVKIKLTRGETLTDQERMAAARFSLRFEAELGVTESDRILVRDGQSSDPKEIRKATRGSGSAVPNARPTPRRR